MNPLNTLYQELTQTPPRWQLNANNIGNPAFSILQALLPNNQLALSQINRPTLDEPVLSFQAKITIFGAEANATFFIIDDQTKTPPERYCLIVFEITTPTIEDLLNHYEDSQKRTDDPQPIPSPFTLRLTNPLLIFSSHSVAAHEDQLSPFITGFPIPPKTIQAGFNFELNLTPESWLQSALEILGYQTRELLVIGSLVQWFRPNFETTFDLNLTGLTYEGFTLSLNRLKLSWDLIVKSRFPPSVTITGELKVDNTTVEFISGLNLENKQLYLELRQLPLFRNIANGMGLENDAISGLGDSWPPGFASIVNDFEQLELKKLGLLLDLQHQTWLQSWFTLTTPQPLELLDDVVAITPLIKVTANHRTGTQSSPALSAEIEGIWELNAPATTSHFDTKVLLPSLDFSVSLAIGNSFSLAAFSSVFPENDFFDAIEDIELLDMSIQGNFKTKSLDIRVYSFTHWQISFADTSFAITNLGFSLYYANSRIQNATLSSSAQIGELYFNLQATYSNGAWIFNGNAYVSEELKFSDWTKKLFGDQSKFPSAIEDLVIENLTTSFNTKTKDFTFTCEAKFPIEGKEVDITVTINITRQQKGSYNKHFDGHITIGDLQFALIFDTDEKSKTFLAAYNNPNGDSLKIKTLVADVSDDIATIIPATLEITLKDALFIYSKNENKSNFLIGLNLTSQFNLSDLPLVGTKIPPEQTIGVDNLQFLVASQNLTYKRADNFNNLINNLIPKSSIKLPLKPQKNKESDATVIKKGFNVSAKMKFGETIEILALPISSESPSTTSTSSTASNSVTHSPSALTPTPTGSSTSDNAKWFKLQKNFGPVHFERVGVQYQDATLWFLLDAALSASGLTLSLDGLAVGSPLNKFDPKFKLKGIGIDYQGGGAVEIGGAFLRKQVTKDGKTVDEYDGAAVIKSETFTLSAIGSYSEDAQGDPSLFIYAVLDKPIGGPSFFFVTGLAAGFGYNRALKIPTIDQVVTFPLVEEAINSNQINQSSNTQDGATKLTQELNKLQEYIPPETGQIFLAVGVKFTSFKIIDSFALLTVAFGNRFEVNLLGLSTLVAPPEVDKTPIAEVQLALKATFLPDEGFLGVRGQLTPNSYILSKKCHLTGGFAFYSWFAPHEHDGDFVFTLGGYHPNFIVPAHYPKVPRLAFNWQVNSQLNIKADGYFALTASALMAGGHLQATWQSGRLRAWFNAGADFLIAWKPYHYDARIYVDMGVSYSFHILFGTVHISVDVGADLHIWGPEFTGKAHIHLWCVSFTVGFGAGASQTPQPIGWEMFKDSFLPKADDVCTVAVKDGFVRKVDQENKSDLGVINPKHLCLVINSVIPIKNAEKSTSGPIVIEQDDTKDQPNTKFGIGSMEVLSDDLNSSIIITITKDGKNNHVEEEFTYRPILKKAPTALWGEFLTPELNGKQFIENTLSGFEIKPKKQHEPVEPHAIDRQNLKFTTESVNDAYQWENIQPFIADTQKATKKTINDTIIAKSDNRNNLLRNLGITSSEIEKIKLSQLIDNDIDNDDNDLLNGFLIPPTIEKVPA
ncbi:MAG: DUF6603 domain-containing protein [Crocosphaera sp.]